MLPTEIKVGPVFRYSYLCYWQHLEGREEGDKDRPCLVLALFTTLEDGTPVRVRPITHTRPARARALDRAGLSAHCRTAPGPALSLPALQPPAFDRGSPTEVIGQSRARDRRHRTH